MKYATNFQFLFVFLNILVFVKCLRPSTDCFYGDDAKKFNKRLVSQHNKFRSRHGVPPLQPDYGLVEDALKWSEYMTSTGKWGHSKSNGYGENLYKSTRRGPIQESAINAVKGWYDEIKDYSFNTHQFSDKTGHFTQLVWKSSRKVGCGVCAGSTGTYVTCRYFPPGNILGEFKKNVLRRGANRN